jgi:RHS repeat-associated protein
MKTGINPLITLVLLKCVYDLMRKGFATLLPDAHGITTSLSHACDARGIVVIFLRCPSDDTPAQSLDLERQPSKFRKLGNTPASIPSRFPLTQPASMIEFAILLHYEYSPFGETIVSAGPMKDEFAFRFSTKYFDPETGLYYYGYRYYSPGVGRWVSRDPIGERGGRNVYEFVGNRMSRFDYLAP